MDTKLREPMHSSSALNRFSTTELASRWQDDTVCDFTAYDECLATPSSNLNTLLKL
jgi:hypothetical protein